LLANNIPKGSSWLLETVPWYICIWSLLLFGCWICSSGAAGFLVDLPSWQFISSCPVLLKFLLVFYVLLFFPLIFKIFNLTWTMHILESSQRQQRLRRKLLSMFIIKKVGKQKILFSHLAWFSGKYFPFILSGKHFLEVMKNLEMSYYLLIISNLVLKLLIAIYIYIYIYFFNIFFSISSLRI